jgi:protein-arginine kinase
MCLMKNKFQKISTLNNVFRSTDVYPAGRNRLRRNLSQIQVLPVQSVNNELECLHEIDQVLLKYNFRRVSNVQNTYNALMSHFVV